MQCMFLKHWPADPSHYHIILLLDRNLSTTKWSWGIIFASGARGPGFKSRRRPFKLVTKHNIIIVRASMDSVQGEHKHTPWFWIFIVREVEWLLSQHRCLQLQNSWIFVSRLFPDHNVSVIWETHNPYVTLAFEGNSPKVTVFCAVTERAACGPFSLKDYPSLVTPTWRCDRTGCCQD